MSNLSRIDQLLSFVKEEPENPFNLYALALEYLNLDSDLAGSYFEKLLVEHKSYLPTYFHAAAYFAEIGQVDKASQTYKAGITLAKSQSNTHALKELNNAYQNFCFDYDLD